METTRMEVNFANDYEYKNEKTNKSNIIKAIEYKLTSNNFNPEKFSPNLFLDKLQYRMKYYHLEKELDDDILEL